MLTIKQVSERTGLSVKSVRWAINKAPIHKRLRVIRFNATTLRITEPAYETWIAVNELNAK